MIYNLNLLLAIALCLASWIMNLVWLQGLMLCGGILCLFILGRTEQQIMREWARALSCLGQDRVVENHSLPQLSRALMLRLNSLQSELNYCLERNEPRAADNAAGILQTLGEVSAEISLLRGMRQQFRARVRALLIGGDAPMHYVDDPQEERLGSYLQAAINSLAQSRQEQFERPIEVQSSIAEVRVLEIFEIAQLLVLRINCDSKPGFLVLGYDRYSVPFSSEIQTARNYARYIESALSSSHKVKQLNSVIAEIREVDRRKGEFMAQFSHDIRSPLNNIQSILSLLRVEGFGPDSFQMIDVALRNCRDAADLVRDILDFARHQTGKLVAHRIVLDLAEVLRDVSSSFEMMFKAKGLAFNLDVPPGRSLCLVDPRHLRRVLANLLTNALQYTAQGEVQLSIDADRCTIRVRDTGMGMSADQVKDLFVPFHTQNASGIGLGLALSKVLCELNQAAISVTSDSRTGTEFVVRLQSAEPSAAIRSEDCDRSLPRF